MRFRFALIFFVIPYFSFGQTEQQRDSLLNEICRTINLTAGVADSVRVRIAFGMHLFPFANKLDTAAREDFKTTVIYRLHRTCPEFYKIVYNQNKTNGDIVPIREIPKSKLDKKACERLLNHPKLFYLESSGDTVKAVVEKGIWIETFKDGTNTWLKFKWIENCTFELEFVKSSNYARSRLSKPGDKYRYKILDRHDSFYNLSVEIVGNDALMTFKIYY